MKENNYFAGEFRKDSRAEFNLNRRNFNRKSQDKVDKPIRFNTEMYDKDD
jgi:hypothetical protein